MGMQITSLPAGNVLAGQVQQELPQEKRVPLPIEEKASAEERESFLLGGKKTQAPDVTQTASALEQISIALNRRLKFEVDQESREVSIKVIDNETDKVIKVLPPEELQRLDSRIRETIGFLFDRMV